MDIQREVGDYWEIAVKQTIGFAEIIRLKIRILGFSNKRSSLMAKLGEAAFKGMDGGTSISDTSETTSIVSDINEADKEISTAEKTIIQRQEDGRKDREQFVEDKWTNCKTCEPADDSAKEKSAGEPDQASSGDVAPKETTEQATGDGEKVESNETAPVSEKDNKQSVAS